MDWPLLQIRSDDEAGHVRITDCVSSDATEDTINAHDYHPIRSYYHHRQGARS